MQHPTCKKWPYHKVKPEHVPVLIERYERGDSVRKICLDMPFAEDAALKVLRDFGVHIKTRKENRLSMGFSVNEEAFLDTSEAECAYFYGWLVTDGNLRAGKHNQLSMELGLKDIKVLESLKAYVGNTNKIAVRHRLDSRTNNTYSTCSYSFQYAPITERLIGMGLAPRKSTEEYCPDVFIHNNHFWRGVLEGDGHLSKLGTSTKMQVCGSEEICMQWAAYCNFIVPDMKVKITKQTFKSGKSLFHTYSGRFDECKAVLDSLYLGVPDHLRLERKYNLYVGRYYNGIDPNRTS